MLFQKRTNLVRICHCLQIFQTLEAQQKLCNLFFVSVKLSRTSKVPRVTVYLSILVYLKNMGTLKCDYSYTKPIVDFNKFHRETLGI